MVTSSDIEYIDTKNIKKNNTTLVFPFDELAIWISKTYNVTVLNIIYDQIIPDSRPRLQIILELFDEKKKFLDKNFINFNENKQIEIKDKFIEILKNNQNIQFKYQKLLVVFSAFEPIAIEEANGKVSKEDIKELEKNLNEPCIWKIRPRFNSVTYFFFTNSQLNNNKSKLDTFTKKYFNLVKKYDEFNYINNIIVELDSKENFDGNYQSSWFYYDR
jgi:hypothetical protein